MTPARAPAIMKNTSLFLNEKSILNLVAADVASFLSILLFVTEFMLTLQEVGLGNTKNVICCFQNWRQKDILIPIPFMSG